MKGYLSETCLAHALVMHSELDRVRFFAIAPEAVLVRPRMFVDLELDRAILAQEQQAVAPVFEVAKQRLRYAHAGESEQRQKRERGSLEPKWRLDFRP